MTTKEVKKIVSDMKKYTKKVTSTKSASRKFLQGAGIIDKSGKLTKPYR